MIAIVNIDKNVRESGVHLYELRINQKIICQFSHDREDPLDICLMKAAKAYMDSVEDKENILSKAIVRQYDEIALSWWNKEGKFINEP